MLFRTKVNVSPMPFRINQQQHTMLLGSCFTENVGRYLFENKFDVEVNPFGITYNPMSAAKILSLLLDKYQFSDEDILQDKDSFFTLMHHSDFSESNKASFQEKIQRAATESTERLLNLDNLLVTFGTSYVYLWEETGEIVNNCHKLPASKFDRKRLTVMQIVAAWTELIARLVDIRSELRIVFTVSPIRHWKDGAHDNQLSKSNLLLAIDELQQLFPNNVFYFPSYEIVLDELRDYRFYNADMIHPNDVAVQYCCERFAETFFDADTLLIMERWQRLQKSIMHRPYQVEGLEYQNFLKIIIEKVEDFAAEYPFIDCKSEIVQLKKRIIDKKNKDKDGIFNC